MHLGRDTGWPNSFGRVSAHDDYVKSGVSLGRLARVMTDSIVTESMILGNESRYERRVTVVCPGNSQSNNLLNLRHHAG